MARCVYIGAIPRFRELTPTGPSHDAYSGSNKTKMTGIKRETGSALALWEGAQLGQSCSRAPVRAVFFLLPENGDEKGRAQGTS
jgi:hypothetical protein